MRRTITKAGSVLGVAIFTSGMATLSSCHKWGDNDGSSNEIILTLDERFDAVVDTKATPVTSIPSTLYWGGTTGGNAAGSATESVKWSCESKSVSSSKINTGRYQTYSPTTYNYYVANQSFTVGSTTTMTVANNSVDVIVGRTAQTSSTTPSVVLNHIFARTGSLSFSVPSGYTQSNVTWKIQSKGAVTGTSGTYNLTTGAWTASSASLSQQTFTSSSDLWLIPGTYTITISFRLTKGDFVKDYTQSQDVNLAAGKVNNISATTTSDEAVQVTFGVSLSAWTSQAHNLTAADFREPPITFGGLMIAPAPLYYNGTTYIIKDDDWNHHSYNSVYGKNAGSYYHTFVDLGQYFDSRGNSFDTSSGNIDNNGSKVTYDGYNDWRLPTKDEFRDLVQVSYPGPYCSGSVINGINGCLYALIQLTGVTYINSTPVGLLLIPDGKTMTGMSRTFTWNTANTTGNTGVTAAQLQEYLDKGCAFFPMCGWRNAYSWYSSEAMYWSATQQNSSAAYRLYFYGSIQYSGSSSKTTVAHQVRLVRSAN